MPLSTGITIAHMRITIASIKTKIEVLPVDLTAAVIDLIPMYDPKATKIP